VQHTRLLTFVGEGDGLFATVYQGYGWWNFDGVGSGIGWGTPGNALEPSGRPYACWADSVQQTVLFSYDYSVANWVLPETVTTFSALGVPQLAIADSGGVHCVWFDHAPGNPGRLRHSYCWDLAGVGEGVTLHAGRCTPRATVVRGVLRTADGRRQTGYRAELLDISGRKVMELVPGENDVSGLEPGVYFVREQVAGSSEKVEVRKVLILW
jgi:hypothetical protein